MNVLDRIIEQRREDVAIARRLHPVEDLAEAARERRRRSLREWLATNPHRPGIIAEIKRFSPSAGMIRYDLSPTQLANDYQQNGAAAISVLTEPHHFKGSDDDLRSVRAAVSLPVLRKDFIVDEYQVIETAALGADLILLIVAALDPVQLHDLAQAAMDCNLEILVEVHDENELERALGIHPLALIGVNSRNLKTLITDLAVARRLSRLIPEDRLSIAESGIRTASDIHDLQQCGYRGFLIGESLLKQGDPGRNLRAMGKLDF